MQVGALINTRKTLIEERQEQHGTHVEIIDCLTSGEGHDDGDGHSVSNHIRLTSKNTCF